jgi:hypothetical protein
MGDARYTKRGFLIPTKWLKGFGAKVRVQLGAPALSEIEKLVAEVRKTRAGRN